MTRAMFPGGKCHPRGALYRHSPCRICGGILREGDFAHYRRRERKGDLRYALSVELQQLGQRLICVALGYLIGGLPAHLQYVSNCCVDSRYRRTLSTLD
jgi:hypothetical protein